MDWGCLFCQSTYPDYGQLGWTGDSYCAKKFMRILCMHANTCNAVCGIEVTVVDCT